jgi:hypothetical protein
MPAKIRQERRRKEEKKKKKKAFKAENCITQTTYPLPTFGKNKARQSALAKSLEIPHSLGPSTFIMIRIEPGDFRSPLEGYTFAYASANRDVPATTAFRVRAAMFRCLFFCVARLVPNLACRELGPVHPEGHQLHQRGCHGAFFLALSFFSVLLLPCSGSMEAWPRLKRVCIDT